MHASQTPASRSRGRPRTFSADEALDAATRVFQRQGYEGASLNDLTAAMGINRPSCYAAFGDKEALFLQVVERYMGRLAQVYREACAQPTARAVADYLLQHTLALSPLDLRDPCLLALPPGPADAGHQPGEALRSSRKSLERLLKRRFERARQGGDLPATADAGALASLLSVTLRGLVSQAAEGVSRSSLLAQAETLLQLFSAKHVP